MMSIMLHGCQIRNDDDNCAYNWSLIAYVIDNVLCIFTHKDLWKKLSYFKKYWSAANLFYRFVVSFKRNSTVCQKSMITTVEIA